MKRLKYLFKKEGLLSLVLILLATFFGTGNMMAMALGTEAGVDESGMKTDLSGDAANAGQLQDADLADREIDSYIAKFRPVQFPMLSDIMSEAKQYPVSSYEIEHFASGAARLEIKTTDVYNGDSLKTASAVISVNPTEAKRILPVFATVCVSGVPGYDEDGNEDGELVLFVTDKTKAGVVTVEALNGKLDESKEMYVPTIPSGSTLVVMANACSESQMEVEPENYQPRSSKVYLQKKICNVVFTDEWRERAKVLPFIEQDVKDDALYNFKRKSARTAWNGTQTKRKHNTGDTMGEEYVYTSRGALRQVKNFYGISDELAFSDMIGISKMQFTTFSANNEANAYCGKNFLEKLMNIDYTKHKDVEFKSSTVLGVDIRAFKTTFGTLNFKYDPTLDDIHMEDFCVVLDIKNAVRYVKRNGQTRQIDMSQSGSNAREAKRDVYSVIDAIALKGYNSILVGPTEKLYTMAKDKSSVNASTLASLPVDPVNGQVVYLTANNGGFASGDLVQYDADLGKWVEYSGKV